MTVQRPVTIVIPVYNDVSALKNALSVTAEVLDTVAPDYEIIIAEDASTDGSAELAALAAKENLHIRHLHRDERLGRGSALTAAARVARGDIFCYFDVDMATDIRHLDELLTAVAGYYDIATGSRLLPGSTITRSTGREIKSRGYNTLVRLILKSRLSDHQCGFKAFKTEVLQALLLDVKDTHWFWDTEVLVRAAQKGHKIAEIPVTWREGEGTTVRHGDIWKMGKAILKLWWQINVS